MSLERPLKAGMRTGRKILCEHFCCAGTITFVCKKDRVKWALFVQQVILILLLIFIVSL
jgi:hypothetical protein